MLLFVLQVITVEDLSTQSCMPDNLFCVSLLSDFVTTLTVLL